MFHVTVDGQLNRLAALQRFQMLEQQTVIHRTGVVVVGFYALFHRKIFGNNTDMLITHLFTQFAIKRTGNKTFT
ncbi:Uncharacterised protein [Enterobacter cloacae]|nr:Uncharacterised protein [Enterobacter cloacae]